MQKVLEQMRGPIRQSPLLAVAISAVVSVTVGVAVGDLRASAQASAVATARNAGVLKLMKDDLARQRAQDTFTRLLSGGLTITFLVYVFVNIGMVSGLLPVVGVPLPLISYGGSSMVTLMASFGMLMSIHTHRKLLKM